MHSTKYTNIHIHTYIHMYIDMVFTWKKRSPGSDRGRYLIAETHTHTHTYDRQSVSQQNCPIARRDALLYNTTTQSSEVQSVYIPATHRRVPRELSIQVSTYKMGKLRPCKYWNILKVCEKFRKRIPDQLKSLL